MSKYITDLMEQQRDIKRQGWVVFEEEYERENPPPAQESIWIQRGMAVGLIAALGLSALLTIPAFEKVLNAAGLDPLFRLIGGAFGFLAIDVVMFMATYFLIMTKWRLRISADTALESFNGVTRWMQVAAIFGFIVSVGSNVYFVFIGYEVVTLEDIGGKVFSFVIALLLALAPPMQAISTGSILALLPITTEIERKRYNASKLRSWASKKGKYEVDIEAAMARLSTPVPPVHSHSFAANERMNASGYERNGSAVQVAYEWIEAHPEYMNATVDELADAINSDENVGRRVGRTSVHKARKQFVEESS